MPHYASFGGGDVRKRTLQEAMISRLTGGGGGSLRSFPMFGGARPNRLMPEFVEMFRAAVQEALGGLGPDGPAFAPRGMPLVPNLPAPSPGPAAAPSGRIRARPPVGAGNRAVSLARAIQTPRFPSPARPGFSIPRNPSLPPGLGRMPTVNPGFSIPRNPGLPPGIGRMPILRARARTAPRVRTRMI